MKHLSRQIWMTLGVLALACGIVGAVLPLIPTTPFILLAAYAFAQSSPRLHGWLLHHRIFGPLIRNWERNGAIDKRTKAIAVTTMAATPLVTWAIGAPLWALGAQIVVLLGAAAYVLTRPSGAPDEVNETEAPATF